jgi:hypothetical protein
MSKQRKNARPAGQIRQSQVVTTFGPGALVDLPDYSVIVGGLDHWTKNLDEIHEPRLVEKLRTVLGVPSLKLCAPPRDSEEPSAPRTGITAWRFPEWFITQDVTHGSDALGKIRSRLLVHRTMLTRNQFIDEDHKRRSVVPVRFVRACRCGHIGDIDWQGFVHQGKSTCAGQLWIDEGGTSGELERIEVRCQSCGARRSMSHAARIEMLALGHCDGSRPWLGPWTKEKCGEPNRLLIRSASNSYFPVVMSVISLPDRREDLTAAVSQAWDFLEAVENLDDLRHERRKQKVRDMLGELTDEEVLEEILSRKGGGTGDSAKSVKQAEMEVLTRVREEVGNDTPEGNFYARVLPRSPAWDTRGMDRIERVVLVHRLREVVAQVGFTRFEAHSPTVEGELDSGVQRAALAREISWLPAVENRGEGVFLQLKTEAVEEWLKTPAVEARGKKLLDGFERWLKDHPYSKRCFPGLAYTMLHSLSHLLITAVSLECGYPASSLRERVYATQVGYGILLYTGSADAEGTLGGLIEAGRQIDRHLHTALELGELCSNDPVCAQHEPQSPHESRFLAGAACHGCLLIAETSCEQFNDFLDRALVVPTVENLGAEFFTM